MPENPVFGKRVGLHYTRLRRLAIAGKEVSSPPGPFRPKIDAQLRKSGYRYGEELLRAQNYRAHTGYTSLLWSF